jgi:hypothetical protein
MACYDAESRTLRATSQENTVNIQKLNEELRKLKDQIDRQRSNTSGTKLDESSKPES